MCVLSSNIFIFCTGPIEMSGLGPLEMSAFILNIQVLRRILVMELTMSEKELDRIQVLKNALDKRISQRKAAEVLNLSPRHIRRLMLKLSVEGPGGLVSRKRGKRSNRAISGDIKAQAFAVIDTDYYDYGPTLITEKLSERHNIHIGKETMRQWLISSGRRVSKQVKPKKVHQLRARRDCFGELVQIDGSIHQWFVGCEPCTLLVFIDDATSKLVELKFVPAEKTLSYFEAMKEYIQKYGKPRAIYTDKHVVFKVNTPGGKQTNGLTQFGRALKQLGIEPIFAHSTGQGKSGACQ